MRLGPVRSSVVLIALGLFFSQSLMASRGSGGKSQLTLSQFNLRWFGQHSLEESKEVIEETRVKSIRKHLMDNALLSDVMVFEEIVDVKLLAEGLLESRYNCQSYTHKDPNHQHVVVCLKPHLKFEKAPGETSFVLEEVNVNGNVRPAVHGIVKTSSGQPLVHLFAVHLKSAPDFSSVRVKQMQVISDYMRKSSGANVPNLIVGDFNTYGDDPENFSRILSGNQMEEVPSPEAFSWATTHENYEPAKFDRAWMSGKLADQVSSQHVIGPCNQADRGTLQHYNDTVSDHCAVKTIFELN